MPSQSGNINLLTGYLPARAYPDGSFVVRKLMTLANIGASHANPVVIERDKDGQGIAFLK